MFVCVHELVHMVHTCRIQRMCFMCHDQLFFIVIECGIKIYPHDEMRDNMTSHSLFELVSSDYVFFFNARLLNV